MFAAQESIRLGAEIDLAQFRRSLLGPAEAPGETSDNGEAPAAENGEAANGAPKRPRGGRGTSRTRVS